jgi:hypothetical protein
MKNMHTVCVGTVNALFMANAIYQTNKLKGEVK